jgi:hypothetical protein
VSARRRSAQRSSAANRVLAHDARPPARRRAARRLPAGWPMLARASCAPRSPTAGRRGARLTKPTLAARADRRATAHGSGARGRARLHHRDHQHPPTDLGTDAAAAAEDSRAQLAELHERVEQTAGHQRSARRRADGCVVRARRQTRAVGLHGTRARSCRWSLPARSSTRANSPKGHQRRACTSTRARRGERDTAPLIPGFLLLMPTRMPRRAQRSRWPRAGRPPAARAKSAPRAVVVPARPVRKSAPARSPRPHR